MFMYSGSTPDAIENNILKYEGSSLKKEKEVGAGDRMVWEWASGLLKGSFTVSYCPLYKERLQVSVPILTGVCLVSIILPICR